MMTSSQMKFTAGQPEHRWWILAVLATAQRMARLPSRVLVAPLLRPGLAEVGVSAALDPRRHANYQNRP